MISTALDDLRRFRRLPEGLQARMPHWPSSHVPTAVSSGTEIGEVANLVGERAGVQRETRSAGKSAKPMISFVIPAHNEEALLGATLQAIHDTARELGKPYEIIVANDASTDRTAEIAEACGAKVVHLNRRQIAATRNAGAGAAKGKFLVFVDADTLVNAGTIREAVRHMERGGAGGGTPVWLKPGEVVPLYARLFLLGGYLGARFIAMAGGHCLFCTREAFEAVGGFDDNLFWGEDGAFCLALAREGSFKVTWRPVLTSGRRLRAVSREQSLYRLLNVLRRPVETLTERDAVQKIWYNSNRTDDNSLPTSLFARISRGVSVIVQLILFVALIWNFIPAAIPPWPGLLGTFRSGVTFVLSHAGLLFWGAALLFAMNLVRQKKPTGLARSLILVASCCWIAWNSSLHLVGAYGRLWHSISS